MKKILIVLMITILSACSLSNTPVSKVELFLNNYINLTEDVKEDLETKVSLENLNDSNKDIYREVLTRQYNNLKYTIKDESIDGNKATVKVNISVYDLYRVSKDTENYMKENIEEFQNNNIFSQELYNTYKLNEMLKYNEKVDYEITFNLTKEDGTWILNEPDRVVLEKIHGLYNYEV